MSWYKWRVILTETGGEEFVLRSEEQGPPIIGPNGESIDSSKSRIVEEKEESQITVSEMTTRTGTFYQFSHGKVVCPPNSTVENIKTFGADVNIVSASCHCTKNMQGDVVSWMVEPNTTVGVLTSELDLGDTVLSVSPTVIENIDYLFGIRLVHGPNPEIFEDLGKVVDIDKDASTITVSNSVTNSWASASTLVQMSVIFVDSAEMGPLDWVMEMGKDRIGSSFLEKGRRLVCSYTNNSMTETHTLYYYLSYMYGKITD